MLFEADYAKNYASILYQCPVDVMARGRAPRGALRVFCEEILFITLVGDRHFGAPLCFPHPGTCHETSKDVRIHDRARSTSYDCTKARESRDEMSTPGAK